MSSYQLYRNTTLGIALQDALDEQIRTQQISPNIALKVLQQFDKSMTQSLNSKVKTRYTFKGKLKVYRYCDNVWTCVIEDTEFKESHSQEQLSSKKVKIVACEVTSSRSSHS